MRNPIKIGEREFKFKKDALLHYKNILNSYNFEELLNEEDFNDILNLLEYDFSFEIDKSKNRIYDTIDFTKITHAKISKVQFNTKCFELFLNDSSTKQFSYTTSLIDQRLPQILNSILLVEIQLLKI